MPERVLTVSPVCMWVCFEVDESSTCPSCKPRAYEDRTTLRRILLEVSPQARVHGRLSTDFRGMIVIPVRPNSDKLASVRGWHSRSRGIFPAPGSAPRACEGGTSSAEIGGAKQRKPRVCLCPDVVNLPRRRPSLSCPYSFLST